MKTLALAASLALVAAPLAAQGIGDMTDAERSTFRTEVRDYLLENPEVLIEAISVLEERQAQAEAVQDQSLVLSNAEAIFESPHDWEGGNPDGDIVLVEFMDYRCGYCRRAQPDVERLVSTDGNIRYIVKEFPILGEQSVMASRFAISTLQTLGDDAAKLRQREERLKQAKEQSTAKMAEIKQKLEKLADTAAEQRKAAEKKKQAEMQGLANAAAEKIDIANERIADLEAELAKTKHHLDDARKREAALQKERKTLQDALKNKKKSRDRD